MQRMSRAQRILLMYLLWKLSQPRVIKQIIRGGGAGIGTHTHHDKYTDAEAVSAVEAEDPLTLKNVTMTGNLDLAGNKLQTTNLELREETSTYFGIYKRDTAATKRHLVLSILDAARISLSSGAGIRTRTGAANYYLLESHDGSAFKECAKLIGGYMNIPLAGDITMLTQKMLKLGVFTSAQLPAAGTAGRLVFNSTISKVQVDDGINWVSLH